MRRSDPQHPLQFSSALSIDPTEQDVLSQSNTPYRFSDATSQQSRATVDHNDPKHLIAFMTQTRRMCRSNGLIPRDRRELIEIGRCSGVARKTTNKIIDLMLESEPESSLSIGQIQQINALPFESAVQKKTRPTARVFIGLTIWALTIVVAMQMV